MQVRAQLVEGDPAAERVAVLDAHQGEEEPPFQGVLLGVECVVHGLGRHVQRRPQPAGGQVVGGGQLAAGGGEPRAPQRAGQEREHGARAGLAVLIEVALHEVEQARGDLPAVQRGRFRDDPAVLLV